MKPFGQKTQVSHYKISDNEQLFLEFTENINQLLWRMSVSTNKFTYISPYAEKIFGRSVELINKDPDNWLSFVILEDRPKISAAINQVKQGAANITIDIKILRADGVIAVLSNQIFPSKDGQGKVIAVFGITSDVTEQYNIALQKRLRAELHKNLSQIYDIKLFSQKTLESICLAIGYDIGELWLYDDKENVLACLVNWSRVELVNFNNKEIVVISKKTKNIFQVICLQTNVMQYSTHSSHLKKIWLEADGTSINLKEIIGIPIVVSNNKIGVMCFYNRHILNMDIDGYKILLEFSRDFGGYIQNKLLLHELKYTSEYDILTGLNNQFSFLTKLKEMIKKKIKSIIIVKLRINNLQLINYTLGFDVGNKILQEMSKKIADFSSSYSLSLSYIDMVALTEPGVFGFLSHQFDDQNSIIDFVEKLLELIKNPVKY